MSKKTLLEQDKYILRLYIADNTPRSIIAEGRLRQLCEENLPGCHHIEVIDLLKHPELARDDQILAVPTLVRELPVPIRKFIGDLTHPERILVDFGLLPEAAEPLVSRKEDAHV